MRRPVIVPAALAALLVIAAAAPVASGCGSDSPPSHDAPDGSVRDGGDLHDAGSADGSPTEGDPGSPDGALDGGGEPVDGGGLPADAGPVVPCPVTFRVTLAPGQHATTVAIASELNGFAQPGLAMQGPDAQGVYTASTTALPGLVGYKLLLDGAYALDPSAPLRKYVGGIENSALRVADCRFPSLALAGKTLVRPASGQGRFTATVGFTSGIAGAPLDAARATVAIFKDGVAGSASVVPTTASAGGGTNLDVDLGNLADGKYTALVSARDTAGRPAKPLRLVFWVEPEAFDWRDAVLYMAMTDRFKDGDAANNAAPTSGVDARVDFKGGDLQGVRQAVASGALDRLGVRAIWLTPFNTNPTGSYAADDGSHQVTGYHGYWPTKAREVEPRIGGGAALHALVKEAHAHGIRVIQDFVVNHVHQEHEYYKAHPEWFRTGCVCGTANCDWTEKRLECLFAPYLPDVNWTNNDVNEQFSDDAVYWLTEYDLDGLRIDAVKHVEDAAVLNMTAKVRGELEAAGTRVFLTGETAMGWSDCSIDCNKDQYATINRYMGPFGLDGQFDFVLYHAVPYRTFFYGDKGMIHADYWAKASLSQYVQGSIMTPYIGSHDTPRSVTLATYRGQAGFPRDVPDHKWDGVAAAPTAAESAEAYGRQRTAMAWLLGLPGAPLIYYGDEYGQWGGADPNNRDSWRGDGALNAEEQSTLSLTQKLGAARRELVALRRGTYVSVYNTDENVLVYARQSGSDVALVAVSRLATPSTLTVTLPASLGLANGVALRDRTAGGTSAVAGGAVTLTLPARGALVLAP